VSCKSCAERRKRLQAAQAEKKAKRQALRAAAIGAVLVVTEAAGKALGIGEGTNERGTVEGASESHSQEG
jgi:hypothetical protein